MEHSSNPRGKFHPFFNCSSILLLIFIFYYNKDGVFLNPNSSPHRRAIELSVINSSTLDQDREFVGNSLVSCWGLSRHKGYASRCDFLRSHHHCRSGGFIDYIKFFYCQCQHFRALGFVVLTVWLMALFYMLGNTAADYFCCNLEKLAKILRLSPTVAGVTLLPFGNGAPDVFASITAFIGSGAGEIGINCVLGGALFVTSVVVGTVCLLVSGKNIRIDGKCFVIDVGFFLFTLISLSLILAEGKLRVWGAFLFIMIYVVYALVVMVTEIFRKKVRMLDSLTPLLPVTVNIFSHGNDLDENAYASSIEGSVMSDTPYLSQWIWASHVAIYSSYRMRGNSMEMTNSLWGWNEEGDNVNVSTSAKVLSLLAVPLMLVRRLTIPITEEERWSKTYAVASASMSPVLLTFLLGGGGGGVVNVNKTYYVVGGLLGLLCGTLSFLLTETDHPPRRFLLPWVLGGFIMSVVWFYIIASELVALLVSLGVILGINPSILGLTVLAWGNSMGDLMSGVALAMSGGGDGVQIAISGCYAGPMFNTLVGLGISMLLKAWAVAPSSYVLPRDNSLFITLGFLMLGLIWALFLLPRNDMRPNRTLGCGLIILYLMFLSLRICFAMGLVSLFMLH